MNAIPENSESIPACARCGAELPRGAKFCPQCGEQIGGQLSTSIATQIMIYAVSFLLSPFGLYFVFKYLRRDGRKERLVGFIALALTIAAIGVMLWAGSAFMQYEMRMIRELGL